MVVTIGVEDGGARTVPNVDGDDEDQNAIRFRIRSKQVHTKAFSSAVVGEIADYLSYQWLRAFIFERLLQRMWYEYNEIHMNSIHLFLTVGNHFAIDH